jgi:hypothetical protein
MNNDSIEKNVATPHTNTDKTIHDDFDEYDILPVEPNYLNMLNLHTIIYNRDKDYAISLVSGVNHRVANDTSEIQEALNSIMVDHLKLDEESQDNTIVNRYEAGGSINSLSSEVHPIYALTISSNPMCYSKSRYCLLIIGSNMMSEENGYGEKFDIVKL